jgi:ammonia channel protein AmtB
LSRAFLLRETGLDVPAMVFIAYQMMFAIITPALISGCHSSKYRTSVISITYAISWIGDVGGIGKE